MFLASVFSADFWDKFSPSLNPFVRFAAHEIIASVLATDVHRWNARSSQIFTFCFVTDVLPIALFSRLVCLKYSPLHLQTARISKLYKFFADYGHVKTIIYLGIVLPWWNIWGFQPAESVLHYTREFVKCPWFSSRWICFTRKSLQWWFSSEFLLGRKNEKQDQIKRIKIY